MSDDSFIEKDASWDDEGWTRVPNSIARDQQLSLEAKGLMLYMASHSSNFRVRLFTIQRDCDVKPEKLRKIMRELTEAGYLTRTPTYQRIDGMNRRGPSRYTLHCSRRSSQHNVFEGLGTEGIGTEALETEALQKPTNSKKTSSSKKNTVEKTTSEEDNYAGETRFEVKIIQPAADFDDFWAIYPKKTAKGYARSCWAKALKRGSAEDICAGASRYAAAVQDWTGSDRTYIKHPTTWLNQECWTDEEMPVRSVANRRETKFERDVRSHQQTTEALKFMEGVDPWDLSMRQTDSPTGRPTLSWR